jgi:hypothetical protein
MIPPVSKPRARILLALRIIAAAVVTYLGGLFLLGSAWAAWWASTGFMGTRAEPWEAAVYVSGAVLCLAIPSMAWWFLFPRARWWGAPTVLLIAAAHLLLFTSDF